MKVDTQTVLYASVGAGGKGAITGLLKRFVPVAGIPDNILTGVVGYFLASKGKGALSDIGLGMLIASVGGLVEAPIAGMVNRVPGVGTSTPASSTGIDGYAAAMYGV